MEILDRFIELETIDTDDVIDMEVYYKEYAVLKAKIHNALQLEKRIRARQLECETNSNKINSVKEWKLWNFQNRLSVELKKLLLITGGDIK